ncbi:MAG: methyltransferase domain-containing protein [Deltaproteobacteria bacterium]|nr:methyltransferase domain-containing protein [Deltaproteobacteria bacterium]
MNYNGHDYPCDTILTDKVRSLPSNERYVKTGWYELMLLRYGLAMSYGGGKDILDTCSGLGWGAFLMEGVCRSLTCIELDWESIKFSNAVWPCKHVNIVNGSVLEMPFSGDFFHLVTAMESIEHFCVDDIKIYLNELYRVLKPGGMLVGSSYFTDTEDDAEKVCSKNKFHLHICTRAEIERLLTEAGFNNIRIYNNKLFLTARK